MNKTRLMGGILIPVFSLLACTEAGPSPDGDGETPSSAGGAIGSGGQPSAGGLHSGGAIGSGGQPSAGGAIGSGGQPSAGGSGGELGMGGVSACVGPFFIAQIDEYDFGEGEKTGQDQLPEILLGPPSQVSTDVVSLGHLGSITVSFGEARIIDGPGVDFIVFENMSSFWFPELGEVAVSEDGHTWHSFPCATHAKPTDPPNMDYGLCAGWHYLGAKGSDFTDPEQAGGSAYDLADLAVPTLGPIRYVRVTDRGNPDRPHNSFDLNAISLVHVRCE